MEMVTTLHLIYNITFFGKKKQKQKTKKKQKKN